MIRTRRRPRSRLLRFDDLGAEEFAAWHRLRDSNPMLDSPFFHPSYCRVVHETIEPVVVAVAYDGDGEVVSLLPGHRHGNWLYPVGLWWFTPFQGIIAAPGRAAHPRDLLPPEITGATFSMFLSPGRSYDPFILSRQPSPFMDVSGGLEAYRGRITRSGWQNMEQARRRTAKAERELGPVRFEAESVDDAMLDRLLQLKREQYVARGEIDALEPAQVAALHRLLHTREPGLRGMMSTVHAGEHLLAAHLGLRSGSVLSWWFTVYHPDHARLVPGWIMLRELVRAAPGLGLTRIDLAAGDHEYKRRAKTGDSEVCQAGLTGSRLVLAVRRVRRVLRGTAAAGTGTRQV